MNSFLAKIVTCALIFLLPISGMGSVSPAAVGWGNLIVPGLGATIRDEPGRGLIEAGAEVGLFFGGTFGAREGAFNIDSTVVIPQHGSLTQPIIGIIMQQAGLKLHMYDTFYNYQQAAIAVENSDREKNSAQALYRGSIWDVMAAPFQWKYLSSPYVFPIILGAGALLFYNYHTSAVQRATFTASSSDDFLYGSSQMAAIPLGSAYGEEPLFRGFLLREGQIYTGSFIASLLSQAVLFAAIHPEGNRLAALAGGLYFGYLTQHFDGDLGPALATHFWIDVISGALAYLVFRREQGKNTPWAPPINMTFNFRF